MIFFPPTLVKQKFTIPFGVENLELEISLGGPIRTLSFHCRGPRVQSQVWELRPHKPCSATKKKEKPELDKICFVVRAFILLSEDCP